MASLREANALKTRELQVFWRVSERGLRLLRSEPHSPELIEIREDIELIADMTEWPRIREACQRYLRADDEKRGQVQRVGFA